MPREVREYWEVGSDGFQDDVGREPSLGLGHESLDAEELLGDLSAATVAELGCGGGQATVALAERGADVVGVDFSRAQLEHARRLCADHGGAARLLQGDVTALPLADGRFDLAFNSWVFQWVADLPAACREAFRVLRPGGRFVFSTPHPFWRVVHHDGHEVRESYFDTGRRVRARNVDDAGNDLVVFHATVGDVHAALTDAGFVIETLREPGTPDPEDYEPGPWGESPPALRAKVPMTLVVAARKPA